MSAHEKRLSGALTRNRAPAPVPYGVLAGQVPVDQVVVGELGVVGDVREVLEHLLAGLRDRGRDGERVHGGGVYESPRASRAGPRWRLDGRALVRIRIRQRVPELGPVDDARRRRALAVAARGTARSSIVPDS